jgi:hypothetical protein
MLLDHDPTLLCRKISVVKIGELRCSSRVNSSCWSLLITDFVNHISPIEFEIKDTTDTARCASYLNLHLEIDSEGWLITKLFQLTDHHCLEIVVSFDNISRIIDHHCLEIVVRFDNISRIIDHHCLEIVVRFDNISRIIDHHCLVYNIKRSNYHGKKHGLLFYLLQ